MMSNTCKQCGMTLNNPMDYHPYAACLMFMACRDGNVVEANLNAVINHGATQTADKIKELEAKQQWQPIETAPRDGTAVLLYEKRHNIRGIVIGFYQHREWYPPAYLYTIHPTHWMPLPEPPEGES